MKKIINKQFWVNLFRKIRKDVLSKKIYAVSILGACIVLAVFFGINAGVLWLSFLLFLVYGWNNKIVGITGVVCLVICAFLSVFGKNTIAEIVAVDAFFLIFIMVVLQIVENIRNPQSYKENHNESTN